MVSDTGQRDGCHSATRCQLTYSRSGRSGWVGFNKGFADDDRASVPYVAEPALQLGALVAT